MLMRKYTLPYILEDAEMHTKLKIYHIIKDNIVYWDLVKEHVIL
jgi:hypothetical protein